MPIQFNSILVPADLTVNTEIAIKKAMEIAEPGATLHLLYIMEKSLHSFITGLINDTSGRKSANAETERHLQQWRTSIEESEKGLKACVWIKMSESIQQGIEVMSKKLKPELIIIGKNKFHPWYLFSPKICSSKIVINTGIAVLTARPGSFHNEARKLIVPVETDIPEEKMKIITGMSKKYRLKVYLVSFVSTKSNPSLSVVSLLNTHRWLSSSIGCPVEYTVLNRVNNSRSLLEYAKKIKGNILLVFAGMETDAGPMNRDIADVLHPESNIEILTIKKQVGFNN